LNWLVRLLRPRYDVMAETVSDLINVLGKCLKQFTLPISIKLETMETWPVRAEMGVFEKITKGGMRGFEVT
jgi:hypothetical protein